MFCHGRADLHLQRLLDFLDISKPQLEQIDVLNLIKEIESLTKLRVDSSVFDIHLK
jgi:hypothetical protein